jgi:hypothetical protein
MMDINAQTINHIPQVSLEEFWQEQIKQKLASGLSRAAYCKKHNLTCSRFAYWEKKLAQPVNGLLPVQLNPTFAKVSALCTLILKNGNQLEVHDPVVLPTLVSLLG